MCPSSIQEQGTNGKIKFAHYKWFSYYNKVAKKI